MKKRTKGIALIIVFIGILALLIHSYFNKGIIFFLMEGDAQILVDYFQNFNSFTIFIFVFLIILEVIFAPIPPLVLYITGGILFGSFLGGTLALIGNLIGAGLAFGIADYWGGDFIKKQIPKKIKKKFRNFFRHYGPLSIFILRVNPLTSSDIFSYAAGLTKMNFWKFILATALGLIPIIYLQSYLGQTILSNPFLFKLFLILGFIYIIIFVWIFIYFKTKKKKD